MFAIIKYGTTLTRILMALVIGGAGFAQAATADAVLKASVAFKVDKQQSATPLAKFTLTNVSKHSVWVLKREIPGGKELLNDHYRVMRDGQELSYHGVMVKPGAPTARDYVEIKAGASYTADTDIARFYDMERGGDFSINFRASQLSVLDSAPAPQGVVRPRTRSDIHLDENRHLSFPGAPGSLRIRTAATTQSAVTDGPYFKTDAPSGYTKCAQTGSTCTFSGTRQVAMGKAGVFGYGTFTSSVACTLSNFPSAPSDSVWCSYASTTTTSSSSSSSSKSSSSSSSVASSSSSKSSSASSVSSSKSSSSVSSSAGSGVTLKFTNCSSSRQSILKTAITDATAYNTKAVAWIKANASGGGLYLTWFGAYSSSRFATVKAHFDGIAKELSSQTIHLECDDTSEYSSNMAYVYPDDAYHIYIGKGYWGASAKGYDSKAGTLIHESSHFNVNGGTKDYVYGLQEGKDLAKSDPGKAVQNADSVEHFAESL